MQEVKILRDVFELGMVDVCIGIVEVLVKDAYPWSPLTDHLLLVPLTFRPVMAQAEEEFY